MAAATESISRNTLVADRSDEAMGARTLPLLGPSIRMSPSSPVPDPMDINSPVSSSPRLLKNNNKNNSSDALLSSSFSKLNGAESNGVTGNPPENTATDNPNSPRFGNTRHNSSENSNTASPTDGQAPNPSKASSSNKFPSGGTMTLVANPDQNEISPGGANAASGMGSAKLANSAFINKLYSMLSDKNLSHLISWTAAGESFVLAPNQDFCKILADYFKHTNVSSFVRQLNMYGFHKVSDVFHSGGNTDVNLWEFKHGQGLFRRGNVDALREIKRRASRQAPPTTRDYAQKAGQVQPGAPVEPMQPMPAEVTDPRIAHLEHGWSEMQWKQQSHDRLFTICQELIDVTRTIASTMPPESPIHQHLNSIHGRFSSELERCVRDGGRPHQEEIAPPPPPPQYSSARGPFFSQLDNAPVSPHQLPQDDGRRLNVPRPNYSNYRPQVPSGLSLTTRRSVAGSSTNQASPLRNHPPAPPPHLANVDSPLVGRRHTFADIRVPAWPGHQQQHNASSAPGSGPWSPSPNRSNPEDVRIQEAFNNYSIQNASKRPRSRPATPPPPQPPGSYGGSTPSSATLQVSGSNGTSLSNPFEHNYSLQSRPRSERNLVVHDSSAPGTRRSSMAHILNPENGDDSDPRGEEDRKRMRTQ